ncbi:MAG: transcriptional regulator [Thermoplasmatota archaeon]
MRSVLKKGEFMYCEVRGHDDHSYDTVARRDSTLILIRTLLSKGDIDRKGANSVKMMSTLLKASPILVIPSRRADAFQDGVLYLRYGIPMMTLNTLWEYIVEMIPPLIFYGPGGHYVSLDGARLRSRREAMNLSLGALADEVGVSRKAIQMYESGMGATVEIALKLEEILREVLISPLDPFSYSEELSYIREKMDQIGGLKKQVFDHLDAIGMEVIPTMSCPFDAITRSSGSQFMTSVEMTNPRLRDMGEALSDLSKITEQRSVMIVSGKVRDKNIEGTPVLSLSEVKKTSDPEKLIEMIRERCIP